MAQRFRQHADEEILDRAAGLFAQHGFAQTSLKSLADAVGLSKAGLLHHYPSKEALYEAAQEMARALARRLLDQLGPLPPGRERDLRALEVLTDIALDRPGLVALGVHSHALPDTSPLLDDQDSFILEMFPVAAADSRPDRFVRITGALSALAVLSLNANRRDEKTTWRPWIIATCFDALGHSRPDAASTRSDQVEA